MKYEAFTLGDVCSFIDYRGKTPPKTDFGIPLITAKIIKNGHILKPQEFISEEFYEEWMRRGIPKVGDIVFTTEAPLGEVAQIRSNKKLAFAQRTIIIEPDEKLLFPDYLFYALQDSKLKNRIQARATGTTVLGIKSAELKKIPIDLPPILIQKKIAAILKSLDEKIFLNENVNQNLEQQAQAVYQQTFLTNAEPTWKHGCLADLVNIKYGKDHKKLEEGIYPVYGSGGVMRFVEKPIYDKESVLIPRKGSLNNVMYLNEPFWSVDTMFYTEMRVPNVAKYVYHFLKSKDLAALNAGSAVPSMTTDILNAMELKIPPAAILSSFEALVAPMYDAMKEYSLQSTKLSQVRDTLLPKLMFGELDVSDIDI